jgi:glucose/arabinose dehydrogenase
MRLILLVLLLSFGLGCADDTAPETPATETPVATTSASEAPATDLPLDKIVLPDGFSIAIYAEEVPNARAMSLSPNGTLFVGSRGEGKVHAVVDSDGDYRADQVYVIDEELTMPTGLAFHEGDLYVGAVSQILRYDDIENHLTDPPEPLVVVDDLPSDRHHGWKFIAFGPDGKLYVPVGAPCNICERDDPYASLLRMNPDGSEREVYARGIRNTVGFDWHPVTGDLYFTDNGGDNLGLAMAEAGMIPEDQATAVTDSIPSCELNHAPEPGMHFGFPYVHQGDIVDPEFGEGHRPEDYTPPVAKLGPHVAPLGMAFYTGEMFPASYQNAAFIAEHGSWNRSEKIGYRVVVARFDADGNLLGTENFATGWLDGDESWGRPVDVATLPDGSLLVSDDQSGTIYRITYDG